MATLLPRSNRSSKVPQAIVSRSVPPYPPADQAAAKDRLVHGPTGRQQVATLPSSSAVEPPFEALSAAMLSSHLATRDYQSTTCTDDGVRSQATCSQVQGTLVSSHRASCHRRSRE